MMQKFQNNEVSPVFNQEERDNHIGCVGEWKRRPLATGN